MRSGVRLLLISPHVLIGTDTQAEEDEKEDDGSGAGTLVDPATGLGAVAVSFDAASLAIALV